MELQQSIKAHTGRIWYADWSPDGELLATCGADKCILIWKSECNAWVNIDKLDGSHTKSVRKVKWSRTGDHLASASFDGTVVIWKKKPGQMEGMLTLEGHENEVKDISWSHEDKYLATCGRDKTIWIWETDIDYEYITIAVLTRHTQDIKCVEFHPTNDILCSGSYDNSIILWEGHGDDWVSKDILLSHESTVWDIKWLGNNLVSVSDDLTLKYWVLEADDKYHLHKTISGVHSRTIYSVDIHQNFICTVIHI
jgi:cytosolic iron-sulfur protein assembly protein CIAO1